MTRQLSLSFSPMRDAGPDDIVAWSQAAEAAGFAGVFIPESFNDSLSYALAVALQTKRLLVGTAIANIYLRHRSLLAQQAAAVQAFSNGRLVLGLGVGHRAVNRSIGIEMGDTFADLRGTVEFLRSAWAKGPHQPRPATPAVVRTLLPSARTTCRSTSRPFCGSGGCVPETLYDSIVPSGDHVRSVGYTMYL